ncbi:hypothetical protein ACFL2V_06185 [Pseudomonadota bacterium]
MKLSEPKGIKLRWLGLPLAGMLAACGGSSGGGTPQADSDSTMSGSVFASSVDGASCEVKNLLGDIVAGPFATSADGGYSITIPSANASEDLVVTCSGGTFTDEATGASGQTAGAMSAYIKAGSASSVHVTPASTIIHNLITKHGKTAAEALAAFEAAFGFSPDLSVAPTDATNPAQDAGDASLLSGLRAAVFSQLAKDLELTSEQQFALFAALADDLADGVFDGAGNLGPIMIDGSSKSLPSDIHNGFGRSMANFRASGRDSSGLTNDKIGVLPFAKTALTENYKVEYVPGMHGAINGKTEFKLKISDSTATAVTGLSVGIMPKMNMSSMTHSTPYEGCSESESVNGEYNCTVYYLMPSVMMGGASMGYWELKVMMGGSEGEKAYFYPTVTMAMAMADTAQVRLKGQNDLIMSMGMGESGNTEERTYYLFKRQLSGMDDMRSFEFYVAAKESMMSFPPVYSGGTLSADTMYQLDLTNLSVDVSTDATNWVAATEVVGYNGRWSANNLAGLTDGQQGTIFVRLMIEGEQKTTDGEVVNGLEATDDANNNYARFSVTPGSVMPVDMNMAM